MLWLLHSECKEGADSHMAKRRRGTNTGIPGLSFSLKRALGVSNAKRRIAKATGIPTTRAGRQRKAGKAMGCMTLPMMLLSIALVAVLFMRVV